MSRNLLAALGRWLAEGRTQIGQVLIHPIGGAFELRHIEDEGRTDLVLSEDPNEARHLANLDDAGAYRPLKTAPNLRHGWRLLLADPAAVRVALDYLYPAMLGVLLSHERGELPPVALRETLGRQTGMYRITQLLTNEQAEQLVGETCHSGGGCLKTILWRLDADQPIGSLPAEKFDPAVNQSGSGRPALPLLCQEACNLLVAAARPLAKKNLPPAK